METIRRGSTPRLEFDVPELEMRLTSALYLTFAQEGRTMLEMEVADVILGEGKIWVQLQQADTLALMPGFATAQLRILFADGSAVASDKMIYRVQDAIKQGVIS